jgi:hypothetical protein
MITITVTFELSALLSADNKALFTNLKTGFSDFYQRLTLDKI